MSYEISLLMRKAESGDATAQYELGEKYYDGAGVPQSYEKAVFWYKKAAEKGQLDAVYSLGWCYKYGEGVSTNFNISAQWLKKAAERGHVKAQHQLGHSYNDGEGVPKDIRQAMYWWEKAAEKGYADSQASVGICYYMEYRNANKAVYWLQKAVNQGSDQARRALNIIKADLQKQGSTSSYKDDSSSAGKDYNSGTSSYGGSRELKEKVSQEMHLYGSGTGNNMAIYYDPYDRAWKAVDYWGQGYSLTEDVLGAEWGTTRYKCSNGKVYVLSTNNPDKGRIYFFFQ